MLNSNCVSGDLENKSQLFLRLSHKMAMKMNLQGVHRGRLLRLITAPVKCYLSHSLSHSSYSFPLETQRVGRMAWLDKVLLSAVILCLGIIPRNIFSCSHKPPARANNCLLQELRSEVCHYPGGAGAKVLVWLMVRKGKQS